jgi:hypothetical protein
MNEYKNTVEDIWWSVWPIWTGCLSGIIWARWRRRRNPTSPAQKVMLQIQALLLSMVPGLSALFLLLFLVSLVI